jgi:ABC-type sugar transport system permease subunit
MLVSSVPAAYVLAKIRFRGANIVFLAIIVAMLLPPQVTIVPVYVMFAKLGLTGTLWPLILPNLLGDAFSIFLLRQFFLTIPSAYADAARIDGNGEWGVLWRVVVPMTKPGIASAAIFLFFNSWNDYYGLSCTPRRTPRRGRSPTVCPPSTAPTAPTGDDHGRDHARDDPRGDRVLLRPARLRRGHQPDRSEGLT